MSRRLRIAVSASFAVVILALLVLWVRSRTWIDVVGLPLPADRMVLVTSTRGAFEFTFEKLSPKYAANDRFGFESVNLAAMLEDRPMPLPLKFAWTNTPNGFRATTPMWLWMLIATLAALAPWRQALWPSLRRFSLRTLLIITTLVAVLLGLGVWLAS